MNQRIGCTLLVQFNFVLFFLDGDQQLHIMICYIYHLQAQRADAFPQCGAKPNKHTRGGDAPCMLHLGSVNIVFCCLTFIFCQWSHWFAMITELDDGKIYRKPLYLMVKPMVSCRFSLKPIHWILNPTVSLDINWWASVILYYSPMKKWDTPI